MYTSSSKLPCKKAFLTSNWCIAQPKCAARERIILTVFILPLEQKSSHNRSHRFECTLLQPTLLYIDPVCHQTYLTVYIHLQPTAFLSFGLSTISQVSFLSNALISSFMARIQFSSFKASCTDVGILIESIAERKLWCYIESISVDTNWDIGYLAQDLFSFLKAIGKSFRLGSKVVFKVSSRVSLVWVLTSGSDNWSCCRKNFPVAVSGGRRQFSASSGSSSERCSFRRATTVVVVDGGQWRWQ